MRSTKTWAVFSRASTRVYPERIDVATANAVVASHARLPGSGQTSYVGQHYIELVLVHDGFGMWCAARRLNAGRFAWPREIDTAKLIALTQAKFDALVIGLPWQRLSEMNAITRLWKPKLRSRCVDGASPIGGESLSSA